MYMSAHRLGALRARHATLTRTRARTRTRTRTHRARAHTQVLFALATLAIVHYRQGGRTIAGKAAGFFGVALGEAYTMESPVLQAVRSLHGWVFSSAPEAHARCLAAMRGAFRHAQVGFAYYFYLYYTSHIYILRAGPFAFARAHVRA